MAVNLDKVKKIHFVGIGGIGISAVARLMKKSGKEVSGSDLNASSVTESLRKLGIEVHIGQSAGNISRDLDIVVYTTAVPGNNPELLQAAKLNIRRIPYPEFLGLIFNDRYGIAVCGTHGKSSTAAIAGILLDEAGLDPTIVVGSIMPKYDSNLRIGRSKYMLIEACEYERAFLHYYPKIVVLNNIELDHTDYYKNIDDVVNAFCEFVEHLPSGGVLICNGDDSGVQRLISMIQDRSQNCKSKFKIVTFGLGNKNSMRACRTRFAEGEHVFKAYFNNKCLGKFSLKIPGLFNVYNSIAALSLGVVLNISVESAKRSLSEYSGIWRRFEIRGNFKGALVISDYAHHPTAVKATIEAAREFYPNRRIFAVFQPHQHNRTKKLYRDFVSCFDDADVLILSEIFDVAGREEKRDQDITSFTMANDIKNRMLSNLESRKKSEENSALTKKRGRSLVDRKMKKLDGHLVFYAKDLEETEKLIKREAKKGDILLIMGAGDIHHVACNIA